jgi:catechol 2,3-dioxygenase-like lactoylglutathione lyase family enzyme
MSTIERTNAIHNLTPLLSVADIEQSVAFYCDVLGFRLSDRWAPEGRLAWCRVERGGSALMLQQASEENGPITDRGCGVEFFFLCDDADALHAEFHSRGLDLKHPKVSFYGMNQLFVKDPDGYQLCFQNVIA